MEITIESLEVKFEREEISTFKDLPYEIVNRIDDEEGASEWRSDWGHFFDRKFPEIFAKVLTGVDKLVSGWVFVELQADLDDDYNYDGYVAVFCSRTDKCPQGIVEFEVCFDGDGNVLSAKFGEDL